MGNKKVVNSSVADRSSYNIHVIHDKKPAPLDDLMKARAGDVRLSARSHAHSAALWKRRPGESNWRAETEIFR